MPRLIDPGHADAVDFDEFVALLDAHPFDPCDEDSFADAGPLLARLGRNATFLGDLAIEELKRGCADQAARNNYGGQVFLLKPGNGRYAIRANFWPAANDATTRASGERAFVYDMPHDHNFAFLTYGYLGPGYWSDYYERDPRDTAGIAGEDARLRFVERSSLSPGKLMLYRARNDVHRQLPPDSFSVSLNILGSSREQPWIDQYRFDLEDGTIAETLNTTSAEALIAIAARMGSANGIDLAGDFALSHPVARMRAVALDAFAAARPDHAERLAERAAGDADRLVVSRARRLLSGMESIVR